MQVRKFGISALVLIGLITASFVVAEMKGGLGVRSADASLLGGNTLYVGGNGANNYTKIQDAIDNASDGDTVYVYDDLSPYYENVVIDKKINLIGENKETTIIDGNYNNHVVEVLSGAENLNISSFTIRNSGSSHSGIEISGNSCKIENCIVLQNRYGIFASNVIDIAVTKCKIYMNSWYGVYLSHVNDSTIFNCSISDNVIGIWLNYESCRNTIHDCDIYNHTGNSGIFIKNDGENNIVHNCNISNNLRGLYLDYSRGNIIYRCNISNNTKGAQLYYSNNNIFYLNNFIDNAENIHSDASDNIWDSSYLVDYLYNAVQCTSYLGNYYDDYVGTDTNEDGVGETVYNIDENDNDNCPLMVSFDNYRIIPSIVYVDDDFNESTVGWGYDHFDSIKDGIDAVAENGTVYVFNGTYYENVVVNRRINLIGKDKDTTIIDGGGNGVVVNIIAESTTIDNFTIRNSGEDPVIKIYCSSNNTITKVRTSDSRRGQGFYLSNSSHNFLTDSIGDECGVYLENSSYNAILNNNITVTDSWCITLEFSNNNTIANNNVSDSYCGISLYQSDCNAIHNNSIKHNRGEGFRLLLSSNNAIVNNTMIENGLFIYYSHQNMVTNNKVNGKPLVYLENISSYMIADTDVGQLILVNCTNVTAKNLTLSETTVGIELCRTSNTTLMNNNIDSNIFGILLYDSSQDNTISNCNIYNNTASIRFDDYCNDNMIYNSNISSNGMGIQTILSHNNTVYNCKILKNNMGIGLQNSHRNIISNCYIANGETGIYIYQSNNSQIIYNNIYNNSLYGINSCITTNATNNYWGSLSGPYHSTLNPNGTGDNVSDNVNFIPWLTALVKGGTEESVKEGENEIDAVDEADTSLEINTTTNNTVRVISYEESPVGEPNVVKSTGKYVQVEVENKTNVEWPIAIKIYYTQEDLNNAGITEGQIIGIYFYNESSGEWQPYNDTGVNTTDIIVNGKHYAGYAWANAWHLTNLTIGADDIKPEISNVVANPTVQKINGYVNTSCVVTDNIGLGVVYVNITYPNNGMQSFEMKNIEGTNVYYYNATYSVAGEYKYYIWAKDISGNINASIEKTFTTNHPPNKPYSPHPSNGATNVAITTTLSWQCNDPDGDALIYDVYFGTSSNPPKVTGNITTNSYSPGMLQYSTTYYWKVVAWDEHGAKNESEIWHFITEEYTPPPPPPNHPPVITITSPSAGVTVNGVVTIQGKASDEDGNGTIQKVEVKIDNGDWITATGTTLWQYEWNTSQVENGQHTIYARAYDGADYSNVASVTITVNNVPAPSNNPPDVKITEPESGSVVNGSVIIKGKAWDIDGNETLQKVEIKIDDGEWENVTGALNWAYTLDTKKLENGNHTIYARSYDGKNYSSIVSIRIEVKNKKGGGGIIPGFELIIFLSSIIAVVIFRKKKRRN